MGTVAQQAKRKVVGYFVSAFLATNLPSYAFDQKPIRAVLKKHVTNRGSFPKSDILRQVYVPSLHEEKKNRTDEFSPRE